MCPEVNVEGLLATHSHTHTQIIKVQEDPSNIPEGETPRSLLMYAFDTNVDACKPGDKVTVTGKEGFVRRCL